MTTTVEIEFSKKWAEENAALFSARFLAFLAEHKAAEWAVAVTQTRGFFTLTARKLPTQ